MTEYAPAAILQLFDAIHAGLPSAINGGIVGDPAHDGGYHRGRAYCSSGDYSVQLPEDKTGDSQAACALDLSWHNAADQYTVSQRLLNAKNDSRMHACRSFFGSTDGTHVTGWDYHGGYPVTSDDSHLWHVHLSILRAYSNDWPALQPIADVITGGHTPTSGDEDMATRVQVARDGDGHLGTDTNTLSWGVEQADPGGVFFGTGKPGAGERGSRLKLGGKNGRSYVSTVTMNLTGLADGERALVALGFCDADTGEDSGQTGWAEYVSDGGDTQIVDTRVGWSGGGKAVTVKVKPSAGCTIKDGAVWSVVYFG